MMSPPSDSLGCYHIQLLNPTHASDIPVTSSHISSPPVHASEKVRSPIGVVAVSGRARQGKSYVLNCLLQQTNAGFKVGPTTRPCTKGLWMWSQPQKRVAPDGSEHYIVLLDTEGIDAYDQV